MVHVYIVGSKGIPARYGGFETFVDNLTGFKLDKNIKYHVSCMNNDEDEFEYNGAHCFNVKVPLSSAAGRILHVGDVLKRVIKEIREYKYESVIVYILGCRIGPLLIPYALKLHSAGALIYCNPDGLEWKRDKWNAVEKKILKLCEKCLVLNSDLAICDSKEIEKYIKSEYPKLIGKTAYIAYGATNEKSACSEDEFKQWLDEHGVERNDYYLIVGRFVPENNYEVMLSEFIKSRSKRQLVIISNVEKNKFYQSLSEKTQFEKYPQIKFVGTVYDRELLKKIREEAYGYIHGHEVGGTNPSLLEAMGSTKLNLLLDVGFNKEVAKEAALYWSKEDGALAELIERADSLDSEFINSLEMFAKKRIKEAYSWEKIVKEYENVFLQQRR